MNPDEGGHDPDKFKLDDALMDVLVQNKDEFVLLFLECGVNLKNFIKNRLYDLYDQVCQALPLFTVCSFSLNYYSRRR